MACIDLRHWHVLTSNPSLREQLDSILLDGQWADNCCMGWPVSYFQSLPTLHGGFFLLALPPS